MTLTITENPQAAQGRAQRLKAATRSVHEGVDNAIMSAASFATLEGYARFLRIQYLFHRDIEALYADAGLQAALPGLASRCRMALVLADMADLGLALPDADAPAFGADEAVNRGTALGWLYVAEGSNMGAALLRKEAAKLSLSDSFGARHLAPSGEGPAPHWRAFTAALDAIALSDAEEALADAGAKAAFAQVQGHIDAQLG
ncbi:biliverdin-producing heme oxygenase [Novosphingobium guangzhouense]|uniref:Heme oxygenase n=1 Tax=Novosphingobium guangzhouense TaxID=1850347 RepID=A0A2K2G3C0_9SPHN|nr:biliverdin-producing heme oxygenase [Novosphingobium guangzhouense]PNU05540.1 heme oxygenase [Novosphingobium guangzhouense]